ncbi:MAG: ChaN family lipoprotein, partial [Deltaproteobacteria bacterium]|nr:ChaN family lipoprotein [Deltaproteobacteria bacterium]
MVKGSLGPLLLLVVAACGGAQPGATEDDRERIEDLETGREVTFEQMITNLGRARVIYVGEAHDDPAHHRAQRAILAALHGQDPDIALGVEMVQRPFQPALDAWVQSEGHEDDVAALLAAVEWEDRWGFDFELYRPLF